MRSLWLPTNTRRAADPVALWRRGFCFQGPARGVARSKKSATAGLWKEFAGRSVPKRQKFGHSPAVEGVGLSGPFTAAFRVAQAMSQR